MKTTLCLAFTFVLTLAHAQEYVASLGYLSPYAYYCWMTSNADIIYIDSGNDKLWRSDGTAEGTFQIDQGPVSFHHAFLGPVMIFAHGAQLYRTDGSLAGTQPVAPGLIQGEIRGLAALDNQRAILTTSDVFSGEERLYVTDLTFEGTRLIRSGMNLKTDLIKMGAAVYFMTAGDGFPVALWKTDGTTGGTQIVKTLAPTGQASNTWYFYLSKAIGEQLYFVADDGMHGHELWISDGTEAGTYLIKDIFPGEEQSVPANLIAYQGLAYFTADHPDYGVEWWRTDGTEEGTEMLGDFAPGTASITDYTAHVQPTVLGDILYFTGTTPDHGIELWRTDGTAAGTYMVIALDPGALFPGITHLTRLCDKLYFFKEGRFYQSDGTAQGTVLIAEGLPPSPNCLFGGTTVFKNHLFFTRKGDDVFDLWKFAPPGCALPLSQDEPAAAPGLRLFPNPAAGLLQAELDPELARGGLWRLHTFSNALVAEGRYKNEKRLSVDLSELPAGVYVFSVIAERRAESRKVVAAR